MSEINSTSTYRCSGIQFNSKSLNPLDHIHPSLINKIKRDAEGYIGCAAKCEKIWEALTKNDFAGSHLTQNVIESVFKEFKTDLSTFIKVSSIHEFMRIFDQDKDGCLDFDEQIQIFSFIKERLENVANNCLQIQAYLKFQDLMKEVRSLQEKISKWQESLRQKIHSKQISNYRREGQNKIDQFCNRFDKEFQNLQTLMLRRRQNFQKKAFYETQALEKKLAEPNSYIKIKPKKRLKELQFQQKLVVLEERVYEALDFRKQLNDLEIKEKDRIDKLVMEYAEQQRQNLRVKHQKQRKQLQIKLQEQENKLLIKMKKEFEILRKKNNLHEAEIKRLQGLQKKWAEKKGLFQPELKRTKKLERQRNQVLGQYKKSMLGFKGVDHEEDSTMDKFSVGSILSNTVKFKLANRAQNELPINKKSVKIENNYSGQINKYIKPHHSQKTFSLCKLYDNNLKEESIYPMVSQQLMEREKVRKYQFTMTKLL